MHYYSSSFWTASSPDSPAGALPSAPPLGAQGPDPLRPPSVIFCIRYCLYFPAAEHYRILPILNFPGLAESRRLSWPCSTKMSASESVNYLHNAGEDLGGD